MVTASAVALLLGPIAIDLLRHDRRRVFTYLASDAYYYLTVGWNFAHLGKLGYDQVRASNGYHPLWQALECLLFVFRLPDLWTMYAVLVLGALVLAAAFVLLGRTFTRDGRLSPLFVLMPLGAFGLFMAPYYLHHPEVPLFGAIWNHVDGMESCLTVFAYSLAAYLFVHGKDPFRFGLSLALLTFARLDHGLFAAALWFAYSRDRRRAAITFAAPVAVYLLLNLIFFGHPLPLSGVIKSSFPHPLRNNWERLIGAFPHVLDTSVYRLYRLAQNLIPMLIAPFALLYRGEDPIDRLLRATALGVVGLGLYDFWFVDLTSHGHWYFPVSLVFMTLMAIRALPSGGWWVAAGSAVACLYCFFVINDRGQYNHEYADFYLDEAPKLMQAYRDKHPRFLEMDDGIIAFSTHFPCMSGSGLHLDRQGFDAFVSRDLYSLAFARGYDRLATWAYINHPLREGAPAQAIWMAYSSVLSKNALEFFDFKIEYQSGKFTVAVGARR